MLCYLFSFPLSSFIFSTKKEGGGGEWIYISYI